MIFGPAFTSRPGSWSSATRWPPFNPTYGRGTSSAALHARCLEQFLADTPDLDVPAHGFFARRRIVVDAAWRMSTIADVARTGAALPLPPRERVARLLTRLVPSAAPLDATLQARTTATGWMLTQPDTLITPPALARAVVAHGRVVGARGIAVVAQRVARWGDRRAPRPAVPRT